MSSDIANWIHDQGGESMWLISIPCLAMVAILFIQSSLDKVVNWQGNKDYFTDHFKNSPLKGMVPLLLPVITLSELLAGFLSAIGIFTLLLSGDVNFGIAGMFFALLSLIQLFFGQRIAKDYAGAATLVPYFLLAAFGLLFLLAP